MLVVSFSSDIAIQRTPKGVHFPDVSNRADWVVSGTVLENSEAVDISAADIMVTVKDQFDTVVMEADNDDGIDLSDGAAGIFEWSFSKSLMRGLDPGTYEIGATIVISDVTSQLFVGTVSIENGVVR